MELKFLGQKLIDLDSSKSSLTEVLNIEFFRPQTCLPKGECTKVSQRLSKKPLSPFFGALILEQKLIDLVCFEYRVFFNHKGTIMARRSG